MSSVTSAGNEHQFLPWLEILQGRCNIQIIETGFFGGCRLAATRSYDIFKHYLEYWCLLILIISRKRIALVLGVPAPKPDHNT
ncbi:hypothetical protein F441_00486 [Phytophthora nicotianae CJ01A1]|uniref:Uncharacterized protein n=6 Tax=Phytophthora nicotianae TaxID=4792 RepID=W2RH73_PHYN3|nr:hypothetical protein PPTG_20728 [Phytophthora nicotianae INRA-310]ETI57149.1 hypothetical protein F443_00490 [Phytophthora nicotianae P1569]ETK96909.1 hypothetical protein L915_00459 [Phytophthora nicotianae]ETO85887.1 hypothetical protein F444_00483 [Phytophthora nicotianae P1976]ETP26961.1 hypothetical protein F441_00486 [Phytophthora nicotianae CJ01A1]ETP54931.1 hypothetical protein F442_00476 [Phytophthora nicotianae P10297]